MSRPPPRPLLRHTLSHLPRRSKNLSPSYNHHQPRKRKKHAIWQRFGSRQGNLGGRKARGRDRGCVGAGRGAVVAEVRLVGRGASCAYTKLKIIIGFFDLLRGGTKFIFLFFLLRISFLVDVCTHSPSGLSSSTYPIFAHPRPCPLSLFSIYPIYTTPQHSPLIPQITHNQASHPKKIPP